VSAPLSLLRLAGLVDTSGAVSSVPSACVPLPQFSLITNVKVKPKNEVLAAINSPGFRPATEVFLESVPNPAPIPNPADATASGTLLEEGPGYCVLQFELPTPAILLNTDAYAPGWTVTPLEPSPQQAYEVMPADYAIRAIPLAAGRHKFRLEYVPPLFSLGKCVSIATVSLILAAGLLKLLAFRKPAHIRSTG
jgi:hypothetical protein